MEHMTECGATFYRLSQELTGVAVKYPITLPNFPKHPVTVHLRSVELQDDYMQNFLGCANPRRCAVQAILELPTII